MDKDPRIAQLNQEIEANKDLVATKYAFKGFGRSTESVSKVDQEMKKGQELVGKLIQVISAENTYNQLLEQAAKGQEVGEALGFAAQALNYAKNEFNKLQSDAKQRKNESIQDILSYDQELAQEGNDKIKIGKSTGKLKKLSGKIKTAESKYRTKSLDKVKPAGDKERKIPSLSRVQSLERAANRINSLKPL